MNTSIKTNTAARADATNRSDENNRDLSQSSGAWGRRGVIPWARRKLPYLKDEFQHLADQFWNFAEDELFSGDIKPAADIAETTNGFTISMDVPGFEPDDIDVQVTKNTVTIRGERNDVQPEEVVLHRAERRCGKFCRTFAIPGNVTENAKARCENGVLTITLPKTETTSSRKIKVIS